MAAKILVVEDESIIRMNIADMLYGEGYEVEVARDGGQARDLFQVRQFDLVITDLVMPELDGFKLIDYIRSISPRIPIILVTAYLSSRAAEVLLSQPADFIAKPLQPDVLLAKVKKYLEATYRGKRSSGIWHSCTNCSEWPTDDYDEWRVLPTTGQFCNECRVRRQTNDCT